MAIPGDFDWVFTVWLCSSIAITILFLFYFNRIFARIVSILINAYTWHFYRVSIEIQALQVSLLGGRVFFKGVRYHGQNETILIHDGFVTWRYWLRRVRQADVKKRRPLQRRTTNESKASSPVGGVDVCEEQGQESVATHDLPCRIVIEARGIEWFVYNRKPAYDEVLTSLTKENGRGWSSSTEDRRHSHESRKRDTGVGSSIPNQKIDGKKERRPQSSIPDSTGPDVSQPDDGVSELAPPILLKLFPIGIVCSRAAMVMGNEHARSVLVAKLGGLEGCIDARPAGPQDQYRQCFDFDVIQPSVVFKQNHEFIEPQLKTGARLRKDGKSSHQPAPSVSWLSSLHTRGRRGLVTLSKLSPVYRSSKASLAEKHGHPSNQDEQPSEEPQGRWLGLSRYLDDDNNVLLEQERWKSIEYGRFETIVNCPKIGISFFWDVPGPVTSAGRVLQGDADSKFENDINKSEPPAYGLDISIGGGTINYGPWADRQRADLQAIFFPSSYADASPAVLLQPGQARLSTQFKIVIVLEKEVVLRIHTREESKDWRWKSHLEKTERPESKQTKKTNSRGKKGAKAGVDPEIRPAGWMEITVAANGCVTYIMDMVAGASGYHNSLEMDLKPTHMTSSVNHDLMWRCAEVSLSCSLPNPLAWRELRKWQFDISIDAFELFILRDHAFLLTDLVNDWTSGPPGDFFTFVPFFYSMNIKMSNFKIYLNANDSNVVNNPTSLDDNTFIVIWGERLNATIGIPTKKYRPLKNKVTFDVDATQGGLRLLTPVWNTQRAFLKNNEVGALDLVKVRGSYNYYSSTSPTLTDTLLMDVHGAVPSVHLYGFLIRYFMTVKDNYFGEDLHFQLQEEYQQKIGPSKDHKKQGHDDHSHNKVTNDLDVVLTITASESSVLVPANLYSAEKNVKIDLAFVSADLRFTNYYMDLEVNLSPLALTRGSLDSNGTSSMTEDSSTQAFLDGMTVTGHRLFGLPPTEPTYVCNWDFAVGSLTGECSIDFLATLVCAVRSFAFTFPDAENALPRLQPIVLHDITFLRAKVEPIKLWLHVGDSAFLFNTEAMSVNFNDWAGERFSERLHVTIPRLVLASVDGKSASRHRTRSEDSVFTYAYLQSSVDVRMVQTKADFTGERHLQQDWVAIHDSRTHRTPWLLRDGDPHASARYHEQRIKARPPAMPFPSMPEPLQVQEDHDRLQSSSSSLISSESGKQIPSSSSQHFNDSVTKSQEYISVNQAPRRSGGSIATGSTPSNHFSEKLGHDALLRKRDNEKNLNGKRVSQEGLPPTSMAFSSAYEMPYFPLQFILPDTDDVPRFPGSDSTDSSGDQGSQGIQPVMDEKLSHTAIVIRFDDGIQAMCTPDALLHVNALLSGLQARDPETLLDTLHSDAVSDVIDQNEPAREPTSLQIRANLPYAALRFKSEINYYPGRPERRTYDFVLNHLVATAKIGQGNGHSRASQSSLHLSLSKLAFVATGSSEMYVQEQARIDLILNRTKLWLVQDPGLSGELQFESLEFVNFNRKVEYLASLVNNTLALGDLLARTFQKTMDTHENRLKSLIYHLSTSSQGIADPNFLTSTAYMLRTTSFHTRTSDTWKLMSRLRHVSRQSAMADQDALLVECTDKATACPKNAREQAISALHAWRSWDLADIDSSSLVTKVFGFSAQKAMDPPDISLVPLKLSLKIGRIHFIIDPGPKQSLLGLENLLAAIESSASGSGTHGGRMPAAPEWNLQLLCVKAMVHLNWGICELLEGVLKQYVSSPAITPHVSGDERSSNHLEGKQQLPWSLHAVLAIEKSSLSLETINLKAESECYSLASSVGFSQPSPQEILVTGLVNSRQLISAISSQNRSIIKSTYHQPSIHGSLESKQKGQAVTKTWTGGGLCRKLDLEVCEDAQGLLGIADVLIRDELTYIRSIQDEIIDKFGDLPQKPSPKSDQMLTTHVFHASLLLEKYTVSLKLLSSLKFRIRGKISRSTLRSGSGSDLTFVYDFDLDHHIHSFTNYANDVAHEVFRTTLPPVNGQILLTKEDTKFVLSAAIALEKIFLDASAIHALLTTLSRKEISEFKRDVIRDAALVQANFKTVSPTTQDASDKISISLTTSTVLAYRGRFSAAGLNIKASSNEAAHLPARLLLDIGSFHADICNESPQQGILKFPEIGADLKRIRIVLERFDGQDKYSCGDVSFTASFKGTTARRDDQELTRSFEISIDDLEINLFPETASSIVDILGYVQQRFKTFNLSEEFNTFRARRLRSKSQAIPRMPSYSQTSNTADELRASLFSSMFALEMNYIQLSWHVGEMAPVSPGHELENLVFSIAKIDLATKKANSARLMLEDLQLQMVPISDSKRKRSRNSALLPKVVFNVAYLSSPKDRRLAFQAVGKSLDLRLTSQFILPATDLQRSIGIATEELRKVAADWNAAFKQDEQQTKNIFGNKVLSSVLVDADFAGAVVNIQGKQAEISSISRLLSPTANTDEGRENAFLENSERSMALHAPGIALKVEYKNLEMEDPSLNAEIKINASSNILHPTVVPLILEMSESIKSIVGEQNKNRSSQAPRASPSKPVSQDPFGSTDPVAILGNCRLNLGLRICKQEFGLTCQPIARVAATAQFADIYITVNTVQAADQRRFFALSAVVKSLRSSVQHVYSRESTGSFELESINLSLMNSRHVSDAKGLSAILKLSPMKININAKQLHDFFLFREIWLPLDIRESLNSTPTTATVNESSQGFGVQRYQQVSATGAFPWNASIAIARLDIQLDLGQSLGKASFSISDFWVSSKKSSDFEQNLCLGFEKVGISSSGRMSGFIELQAFRLQTSIQWPTNRINQTPLIEASLGFDDLRVKAAFEYQAFLIAEFSSLKFLMYNVRDSGQASGDRLVCTVNGDQVSAFCTTQSASQTVALYQTVQRMIQEKRTAYQQSLRDVEQVLRRKSTTNQAALPIATTETPLAPDSDVNKTPMKLKTNVVVSLKSVKVGAYPSSFFDNQIFKLEALDASAKFSVAVEGSRVESGLGLQLGQVRVALSSINSRIERKTLEDISVEEIVKLASSSRGGTILKVPRVVATMRTWQSPYSTQIDYVFRSSFEGKVEVGWNYSRITYIRGMWAKHSRALAQRLGKPLPQSAVQITGDLRRPESDGDGDQGPKDMGQGKITAVVNVPLSKYSYTALEPPIIVTPQLRDMGEATPPLEWIGLHRDRLPNLTHQIVIVPLLEVAKEVEDAYSKILGAS